MLFLKQPLILPFLCDKSATTCQINSNKISNSKSKICLCSCVKKEIEYTAPPQWPHKRGTMFFEHSVSYYEHQVALRFLLPYMWKIETFLSKSSNILIYFGNSNWFMNFRVTSNARSSNFFRLDSSRKVYLTKLASGKRLDRQCRNCARMRGNS